MEQQLFDSGSKLLANLPQPSKRIVDAVSGLAKIATGVCSEMKTLRENLQTTEIKLDELTRNYNDLDAQSRKQVRKIAELDTLADENRDTIRILKTQNNEFNGLILKLREIEKEYILLRQTNQEISKDNQRLDQRSELATKLEAEVENMQVLISEKEELLDRQALKLRELGKLQHDYELASQEIIRKNHVLIERTDEANALRETIAELEAKVFENKKLKEELYAARRDNKDLGAELDQMNDEKLQRQIELENFRDRLQGLEQINEQLTESKDKISDQESALASFSAQLYDLQKQKADAEKELKSARNIIDKYSRDNERLMLDNNSLKSIADDYEHIKHSAEYNAGLVKEYGIKIKSLNASSLAKDNKIKESQERCSSMDIRLHQLEQENTKSQEIISRLSQELKADNKELIRYKQEANNYALSEQEKLNLQRQLRESIDNNNRLKKDMESLFNNMKATEENLSNAQKELSEMNEMAKRLSESENLNQQLEEKISEVQTELERQSDQMEELHLLKRSLNEKIGEYSSKLNEYEITLRNKDEEIANLKDRPSDTTDGLNIKEDDKIELIQQVEHFIGVLEKMLK